MLDWFFLSDRHAQYHDVEQGYSFVLIIASYAIAVFAAFVSFSILERVVAATKASTRLRWLMTGAVTMGAGIWSMHFSGMMALEMPAWICGNDDGKMHYNLPLTLVSALFAILASGSAFYFVSQRKLGLGKLLLAGTVMGGGIGLMHYTGMAAMQMYAVIRYEALWFLGSVLAAVVLSSYALWHMSYTLNAWAESREDNRGVAAAIMGFAITLTHYAGMAATHFLVPTGQQTDEPLGGIALNGLMAGGSINVAAILLMVLAYIAANKQAVPEAEAVATLR